MYSALILFVPLLLAAFACLGYLHLFAKIRLSPLQYLIIPSILPAVVLQAGIPVNDTFSTLLYLILEAARDYLCEYFASILTSFPHLHPQYPYPSLSFSMGWTCLHPWASPISRLELFSHLRVHY